MQLKVIARIRSDFSSKFGIPRQSGLVDELEAAVVFEPGFRGPSGVGPWLHSGPVRLDDDHLSCP